jgi:hypothetical protein
MSYDQMNLQALITLYEQRSIEHRQTKGKLRMLDKEIKEIKAALAKKRKE